jgi:predicted lipid-binding transport protein (Tim44 family)
VVSRFRFSPHIAVQEEVMTGLVIGMAILLSAAGTPPDSESAGTTVDTRPSVERQCEPRARLTLSGDLPDDRSQPLWRAEKAPTARTTSARQSSTAAKVIGIALGGLAGFYAGGMIGFYLAQHKHVDDDGVSGLRGVVIGAPVGAAAGALIGYQIAK